MRFEAAFFLGVTAFFVVLGVVYWFTSYEQAGTVMLLGSGILGLLAGGYLLAVARRIPRRPEDDPDARLADGAGAVGWFPTTSIWPFALAAGAAVTATGLAVGIWVALLGAALFAVAVAGMVTESRRSGQGGGGSPADTT